MEIVLRNLDKNAWLLFLALVFVFGCGTAKPPPYQRVIVLTGTHYEMGFQQGRRFKNEIRSLYTTLLTSSLLPYLNREQPDIASVLHAYNDPKYANGKFSYEFLMDSAKKLETYIPKDLVQEMHGVADGADFPYDKVLLMNTLLDAMFNMRALTFFIRAMDAPKLVRVEFLDKNGKLLYPDKPVTDTKVPEDYAPSPHAIAVEVPTDGAVRFWLRDQVLTLGKTGAPEGVDPDSIRLQWNEKVLHKGDPEIAITNKTIGKKTYTIVTFQPAMAHEGFKKAAVVSVQVQAGDKANVTNPPPPHAHMMRDERIVFTTKGYGKQAWEVPNKGARDPRFQPPSTAFAVRGSATPDHRIRLAQHFAMLDSNTLHKHTVVFFCKPKGEKPFMYVGWTGVISGFAGMNVDGLAYAVDMSDTLNNGMTGEILHNLLDLDKAKMEATGVPGGIMGRVLLEKASTVEEAAKVLKGLLPSFGWSFLLADAKGGMRVVEVHQDILKQNTGYSTFTVPPKDKGDTDQHGRPWASVGPDDMRIASNEISNQNDIDVNLFGMAHILPQRFWTSFYFRSLRAFYILGDEIRGHYGKFDVRTMVRVMRDDDLVDHRDSMNAVVLEPQTLNAYVASGVVPATSGTFNHFNLGDPATWVLGGDGNGIGGTDE